MHHPSRPTLKSVAARAGVSVTTAADILRATPEQLARYHADTVTKVRAASAYLCYPNRSPTGSV
ncbi:MAG: LacI family DNA-binding transcriptional regulator [Verrucomicrobia bacterium]|nr:LacI family DNA-binding transcriptional regulator [Verrucomicrobiota bacterium]